MMLSTDRTRLAALVTLALMPASLSIAQAPDAKEGVGDIVNRAAGAFLKRTPQAVGLSIGVFHGGKTYTYNYGSVEKGRRQVPSSRTLYRIASITKTFTGTLLAQAALEGRVRLDDDIRKYLDGDYPNLEFQGHPITLCLLVNHRSGLPFFLPDKPETLPGYNNDVVPWTTRITELLKNYTRKDFFADLHKVTLSAIPNSQFKYSNAAAQLLSYILERVEGRTYEELVREKITGPLGMRDTIITLSRPQRRRLAKGYDEKGALVPDNPDELQAAGALKSTVADMLRYAQWQTAETDEAVKLSHQPTFTNDNYSAGLNWQMLKSADKRLIWQSGNIPGFDSNCMSEPELHMGLVILANEEDRSSSHELSVMANVILKALDSRAVLLP